MGARAAPSACESVLRRQVEVVEGIGSSSRVAERGRVQRGWCVQDVPSECFFPRQGVAGSAGRAPPQWRAPSPESRVSIR
jgi:hypothetical protein